MRATECQGRFPPPWSAELTPNCWSRDGTSVPAACCARSARPVQIHCHLRIEAPRNRFNRSTLKLGRKAALGLGDSAAAIHSHSQERRDLFALGHALSLGGRLARSIRSNGLV